MSHDGEAADIGRVVVIGVGNPFRGDDGAGIEAARLLRGRLPNGVEVMEQDGEPAGLLDAWHDVRIAYVIDAVRADGLVGEIYRVQIDRTAGTTLPASPRRDSSHALGLGDAVELARILDRLPGRLVLLGIAGAHFEAGDALSTRVHAAVEQLVETLVEEVSAACA
ncbi:MAG: hydrogenase maturation protease [Actinomycetota bacterium]